MPAFEFLLAALAVWRVTHLLVFEMGPADVFEHLRRVAAGTWLGRLLDCFYCFYCFYCTSLWTAVPFAALLSADLIHGSFTGWPSRAAPVSRCK